MNTGLFAGAELAQAWQKGLESWWSALLLDPRRLEQLAGRLSSLGLGSPSAGPRDLAQVLRALELLEGRVSALEGQVKELAEGLGGVLALLSEETRAAARPARRTRGAKR